MKKVIIFIAGIFTKLRGSTTNQSNQSHELEAEDLDPLISINYCPELEELIKEIPTEDNRVPNWENIESIVFEIIQHELQEYSTFIDELNISVCNEEEWNVATIKKGDEILIRAKIDDLAFEYYMI